MTPKAIRLLNKLLTSPFLTRANPTPSSFFFETTPTVALFFLSDFLLAALFRFLALEAIWGSIAQTYRHAKEYQLTAKSQPR